MDLSKEEIALLTKKLLFSRSRVLLKYGFLGLLLMHMKMKIDSTIETAATDGEYMYFSPVFLNEITDNELDFIMMHEILHVILKHCFRDEKRDPELFNIACDIVINSIILKEHNFDLNSITLEKYGTSMHLTPSGVEGCEFTAEEVYEQLILNINMSNSHKDDDSNNDGGSGHGNNNGNSCDTNTIDDHSKWKNDNKDSKPLETEWDTRIYEAVKAIQKQNENLGCGSTPSYLERLINKLTTPQIDWRYVLNEFIQEEVNDYSFMPPDNRYDDFGFFLPSYSEKDENVKNVLFMIDTSGSITDEMLTYAFSEVCGALNLFDGKLSGTLAFFDVIVQNVIEFENVKDVMECKPKGGGGTSFDCIFEYAQNMDEPPVMIIILTDGYAPFPTLNESFSIPILWLINNDKVTPPYGKIARIKIEQK